MLGFSSIIVIVDAAGEGMVELSVEAHKRSYRYQESIILSIEALNISGNAAKLSFDSNCTAQFTIDGSDPYPRDCASEQNQLTIEPSEKQEWSFTITPGINDFPSIYPGEHEVVAFLPGYEATALTTFNVGFAEEGEGAYCGGPDEQPCGEGYVCKTGADYFQAVGFCVDEQTYTESLFDDVSENHWALPYITNLVQEGVVNGYEDGTFRPDAPVTRAELVKMALSAAGIEPLSGTPESSCDQDNSTYCTGLFEDLDTWQEGWVFKAQQMEIVEGLDQYTFNPNANVTRAEALKIMILAFGTTDQEIADARETVSTFFPDVDYNYDWFGDYVVYATEQDMLQGYPDGSFGPHRDMTRAEAAKLLDLLM